MSARSTSGIVRVSARDSVWISSLGLGSGRPDTAYWNGTRWIPLRIGDGQLSSVGGGLTAFVYGGRLKYRPAPPTR